MKVSGLKTALVIDQDQRRMEELKNGLSSYGYEVSICDIRDENWKQSLYEGMLEYDVAVIDWKPGNLPDSMLWELRKNKNFKNTHVLMLVYPDDRFLLDDVLPLGLSGVIEKPLDAEKFRVNFGSFLELCERLGDVQWAVSHLFAALYLESKGKYEVALRHFEKLFDLRKSHYLASRISFLYRQISLSLSDGGSFEDGHEAISQINSDNPFAELDLTNTKLEVKRLLKLGRLKEAYNCAKKGLNNFNSDPDLCNLVGVSLTRLGDANGAIEWYQKGLRFDPTHGKLLRNLATAFEFQNKPKSC